MKIMNLPKQLYACHNVECFSTTIAEDELKSLASMCDLLVLQPVSQGYRGKTYLNTSFILSNRKHGSKTVIFDSCHFDFYFPDLQYLTKGGVMIARPCHYHHRYMIEFHDEKRSIDEYITDVLQNEDLIDLHTLEVKADQSLKRLMDRYQKTVHEYSHYDNVKCITIHDFVKQRYKKELLFYSMNHPARNLLIHICEAVSKELSLPTVQFHATMDPLARVRPIMYSCLQKAVEFKLSNYVPLICDRSNEREIVQLYFDAYDQIKGSE